MKQKHLFSSPSDTTQEPLVRERERERERDSEREKKIVYDNGAKFRQKKKKFITHEKKKTAHLRFFPPL